MNINYLDMMGKRPLVFNNYAAQRIEAEFGGLEKLGEVMAEKPFETLNKLLIILLDAGQKYSKIMNIECPEPLVCEPGDLIDVSDRDGFLALNKLCMNVISGEREVEVSEKN